MIIQSTRVYIDECFCRKQIEIDKGKIIGIYDYGQFDCVDYGDCMVIPGLVDVHMHGYMGCDANHASVDFVHSWMKGLLDDGVTSCLCTTSTCEHETILKGMENIYKASLMPYVGSHILGIYSEGPFIAEPFQGAQSLSLMQVPTKAIIDDYIKASGGLLKYVMMAPEKIKDYSLIDYCKQKGIVVSIGHTGATFEQCSKAIAHGANSFTHTFNGMKGLHHREAGVVGAAMYYAWCYAELIGDGIHVCKETMNILGRLKGKNHLILVTDAISLKGYPVGDYGDYKVCEDGVCRLPNGVLAGSCNRLNKILQYAIEQAQMDVVTCVNACTINPCQMLGIAKKGLISMGFDADIVVLDDDFEPKTVFINGKLV